MPTSVPASDPVDPESAGDPRPHIVVVGAGFGGLAVVRGLRGLDVRVSLIDRQNHHLFQPLLYQVATAALSPADIAAPVRTIVKRQTSVYVLMDEVVAVDPSRRTLSTASGGQVSYDVLVLATGARHSYFGNDAWEAHAPGIKTIDDAIRVRRLILLAMERAETKRQETPHLQREPIIFIVIGGGPTGVEMAGAIAELTRNAAAMDFRFITPTCVKILLVEAGDRLLAAFPPDLASEAKRSLETLGVEVRLKSPVTDIDAEGATVAGERIEAGAIVWAAGVQASAAGDWIGAKTDRAGRILVAEDLSVPGLENVYAIGDTVSLAGPGGRPIPGVAPAAKQQGAFVASKIAAVLKGRRGPRRFRYADFGSLATIGRKRAVIDFGWAKLHGLAAWLIWSTAHLYFLVNFRSRLLIGLTWLWSYLTFDRSARLITGEPEAARAPPHPSKSIGARRPDPAA